MRINAPSIFSVWRQIIKLLIPFLCLTFQVEVFGQVESKQASLSRAGSELQNGNEDARKKAALELSGLERGWSTRADRRSEIEQEQMQPVFKEEGVERSSTDNNQAGLQLWRIGTRLLRTTSFDFASTGSG